MSRASSLPEEADDVHGPTLPKRIRLSKVAQIAAERFEGGVSSSLKEALAPFSANPPATVGPELTGPDEAGRTRTGAEPPAPTPELSPGATPGEPRPNGASSPGLEPPPPAETAEATTAIRESASNPWVSQATAQTTSETSSDEPRADPPEPAPVDSGERAETPSPAPSVAETIEGERPLASAPGDAHPSDLPIGGGGPDADTTSPLVPQPLHAEPTQVVRPLAGAYGAVLPLELASELTGSPPGSSFAVSASIAPASAYSETIEPEQPLASALGAAAKLAADANAAAEALDNLKRLLERQLPNPAQAPRQSVREIFAESTTAHEPPPLLPQDPPAEMPDYELPAAPAKPSPRASARSPAWRERRQFDFRGFMAGFALSWAIGAALYIYLTAG